MMGGWGGGGGGQITFLLICAQTPIYNVIDDSYAKNQE